MSCSRIDNRRCLVGDLVMVSSIRGYCYLVVAMCPIPGDIEQWDPVTHVLLYGLSIGGWMPVNRQCVEVISEGG